MIHDYKNRVYMMHRLAILQTLVDCDGRRISAAVKLGFSRSNLNRILIEFQQIDENDPDFIAWNEEHS